MYSAKFLKTLPKYLRASIPKKGPVIGIDLDDVVADFASYSLAEMAKGRHRDEVHKDVGLFRNLPLIKGAKEGVEFLDKHFEIYFVSTAMWTNDGCWTEKKQWVSEHFPKVGKKKLILTSDKGLFAGDYLIDDRIANGVGDYKGKHIHFGTEEFPDWTAVTNYFDKLIRLTEKARLIESGNTAILPSGEIVPKGTAGSMNY
jgi:5'(3')-deoxyribonucleotidase